MSLFDTMDNVDSGDSVAYNTGTLFDLASGIYQKGVDGKWYLNGGFTPHINALVAMNGNFKSTLCNSLIQRSHGIYGKSEVIINDTENSLDKDKPRAINMAEELKNEADILWMKGIDYDVDSFDKWIKDYCIRKEAARKEYTRKSPFVDTKTLSNLEVWVPTFLFLDSITELVTAAEEEMLDGLKSGGIGDSKANTVYMVDGNKKTLFLRTMRRRCQRAGIVLVTTGHYDKTIAMDMYNPNPKETLFSKQDWKVKGAGSKLKFLTSIYARAQAALLVDSNKDCLYADGKTPSKDLYEADVVLERCKTANAGEMTPFVVSQTKGLLNALTNYHYLRLNNYYGLNGSKMKQQPFLLPEVTISRNSVRELASADYKIRRALEISAQLCFIQNNWNIANMGFDMTLDPSKLFDKLISDKNKSLVDDILNSRSYWTYDDNPVPYLSIFDILTMIK